MNAGINQSNYEEDGTQTVLLMENVDKQYGIGDKGFLALKGVNLTVTRGEFLAIVGKSGSGKSTLLNLLGGIDQPTKGKITINGNVISSMSENQLSRFRGETMGFVFQFFQLMPTLTILENVIMPMDFLNKVPSSKRKGRAEMLLSKVGVLDHANKFPSSLSGGEQQRVAIARALSNNPQIILADEPTGNLDSQTAEDVFILLRDLALEGKNVIMITHNVELAEKCKRIVTIKDGLIIKDFCKDNDRRGENENRFEKDVSRYDALQR